MAIEPIEYEGLPLAIERGELFSASGACTIGHDRLIDSTRADVSIGAHRRSTMMANAARDPYFRVGVRIEMLAHPDLQAVIEDKCTRCHTPLAQVTALVAEGETRLFDDGFVDVQNALHSLANVRSFQGAEIDRLIKYYQEVPNLPVVVASTTTTIAQDR